MLDNGCFWYVNIHQTIYKKYTKMLFYKQQKFGKMSIVYMPLLYREIIAILEKLQLKLAASNK